MDIRFYNLDFNLLYILPAYCNQIGYVSCNTTKEFCNNGSFEIVFVDDDLETIVENHKNNLLVKWGEFLGILTGYQWDNGKSSLFGLHLNAILNRRILRIDTKEAISGNVEDIVRGWISATYDYLIIGTKIGVETETSYTPESYQSGDKSVQGILSSVGMGYEITADFVNKQYIFNLLVSKSNPLIISANNLNAYDYIESYDNKTVSSGGWYKKKETVNNAEVETWTYYNIDSDASGIHRIETSLSATTENEAKTEISDNQPFSQITCTTKDLKYKTDYVLGDIVRVQNKGKTNYKKITAVNRWHENEEGEQPILSEV